MEQQDFILFDVQTTGTSPESSRIIEAGWGLYRASRSPELVDWRVHLIELPEGMHLPRRIQMLTGLGPQCWVDEGSITLEILAEEFARFLQEHAAIPVLVHFAQFKKPFLLQLLAATAPQPPPRVVCTLELSRLQLPHLKSYSLRAVAGYAGYSLGDRKRCRDHLLAMAHLWRYFATREPGAETSLASQKTPLEHPDIRQKRLNLPDQPGVYRFLDQSGRILYVGKASSLKHRLNSYFRGRKTKGSRLNEMLTRACDFQYERVDTELAALILESDRIKEHNPPYNRLLKGEGRRVQSLRANDELADPQSWGSVIWGPMLTVQYLRWLLALTGLPLQKAANLEPRWIDSLFNEEVINAGKILLFNQTEPDLDSWQALIRETWEQSLLAAEDEDDAEDENLEEADAEAPMTATPEQAAGLIRGTVLQVLHQIQRGRWLLRLYDCDIHWTFKTQPEQPYHVEVRSGKVNMRRMGPQRPQSRPPLPRHERWAGMDLAAYDRLTILYHELRKGLRRGDDLRLWLKPDHGWEAPELRRFLAINSSNDATPDPD